MFAVKAESLVAIFKHYTTHRCTTGLCSPPAPSLGSWDPLSQVWASGFSAAILRKRSSMTRGSALPDGTPPAATEPSTSTSTTPSSSSSSSPPSPSSTERVSSLSYPPPSTLVSHPPPLPPLKRPQMQYHGQQQQHADAPVHTPSLRPSHSPPSPQARFVDGPDAVERTLLSLLRSFFSWLLHVPTVKSCVSGSTDCHER